MFLRSWFYLIKKIKALFSGLWFIFAGCLITAVIKGGGEVRWPLRASKVRRRILKIILAADEREPLRESRDPRQERLQGLRAPDKEADKADISGAAVPLNHRQGATCSWV